MILKKDGYSFVELIVVVVFIGVIAAIAVPRFNYSISSKMHADTIARKIITDLRRTRNLAISNAAVNTEGFALNMTGSSVYTGYEIQNLDTLAIEDSQKIDSDINCTGGAQFKYGPLGNLLIGSDNQLAVSAAGKTFTISIIPATGMVQCIEN